MLTLLSPAKVNLFLRVMGKREDGYHQLFSLFQAIDLYDALLIEASDRDRMECDNPTLPTDEANLVWKAVSAFRKKTGVKQPLKITLKKLIPVEAGLGGGSSNAATTLYGLNRLFNTRLSEQELRELAVPLGSDVPFFLSSGTAYYEGGAESLRPLPSLTSEKMWIVKPPQGVSTKAVYARYRQKNTDDPKGLLQEFLAGKRSFYNDLEAPSFEEEPSLCEIKKGLLQHSPIVCLSGSGSSFFCMGKEPQVGEGLTKYACQFTNRQGDKWYGE